MGGLHSGLLLTMDRLLNQSTKLGAWIASELSHVVSVIQSTLHNESDAVNELCAQVLRYQGKMLRPSLVLMSWKSVCESDSNIEDVRKAAAVFELIHLATLVHDDVLDEATLRRGGHTVSYLHGNETAVMLGDYLLSSAYHLCSTIGNPKLNMCLGEITTTVCSGEISQLTHRNNLKLTQSEYYTIIKNKTAVLIAGCCSVGSTLGRGTTSQIKALYGFGERLGVAFQVRDDLLDLMCSTTDIGKPAQRDFEKGKPTLPLILYLNKNKDAYHDVCKEFESGSFHSVYERCSQSGCIEESVAYIGSLVSEAQSLLRSSVSNSVVEQLCELSEHLNNPIEATT